MSTSPESEIRDRKSKIQNRHNLTIPFLNLKAQYESLKAELLPAVEAALASGHYVLGPNVKAFEEEIAAYTGTQHGIGVNSGSDALTLALRALEIGPGDELITTPFSYIAPADDIVCLQQLHRHVERARQEPGQCRTLCRHRCYQPLADQGQCRVAPRVRHLVQARL
jgi:cystathionine beta-lyase/cystathionine gamma-synthase